MPGLASLRGDFVPGLLLTLVRTSGQIKLATATASAGVLALMLLFLCEKVRRLPGTPLVIVRGVTCSGWLAQHGVALTGAIDLIPQWTLPAWPSSGQWVRSIELSAALLLVLYAESYRAIRAFALKHGAPMDPNRDLWVIGLANALSGLFHGMPLGASYSETSAHEEAGARSRVAGLAAAGSVLLMVSLLLRWIERISELVLAAIVIHAVSKSWRLAAFRAVRWKLPRCSAMQRR